MRVPATLLTAAAVAFAIACAGGEDGDDGATADASATAAPACAAQPAPPGDSRATIDVAGVTREYLIHLPTGYDGRTPAPLIVAFHQSGATPEAFLAYTALTPAAEAAGYVVATPLGAGTPPHWNPALSATEADDVAFVSALLARLRADLCVDPERIYLAGFSDGAGMALRLACALPETFAAVAVVAARWLPCQADVPTVAFHGTDDARVLFEGDVQPADGSAPYPPVRRSASEWARGAGCDGLAEISRPAQDIELSTFKRCRGGDGEVLLYTVIGGGHTWPGSSPLPADAFGPTSQQLSATDVIIAFFEGRARR